MIFNVLGTPDESELSHLDSKSARDIRALPHIPRSVRTILLIVHSLLYGTVHLI